MKYDVVLIIDFGSQVTQLIARRLRELNVYCEIHPFQNVDNDLIQKLNPQAIILSGGPASVLDKSAPKPPQIIFDIGIPILGICYGQQIMMKMLGGEVVSGSGTAEFGKSFVSKVNEKNDLLEIDLKIIMLNKFGCLMEIMFQEYQMILKFMENLKMLLLQ